MVKYHSGYDILIIIKILVENNHVHHFGIEFRNNLGGIKLLKETNG